MATKFLGLILLWLVATVAADEYKMAWMYGDAAVGGKHLSPKEAHKLARKMFYRWSNWNKGQTFEQAITELEKEVEKGDTRPIDVKIWRVLERGTEPIMDTRRANAAMAIHTIKQFDANPDEDIERMKKTEQKPGHLIRWKWGDANLLDHGGNSSGWMKGVQDLMATAADWNPFRWSHWVRAEDAITQLEFNYAPNRGVEFSMQSDWNISKFETTDGNHSSKDFEAAKKWLQSQSILDKPGKLSGLPLSVNVWDYMNNNMSVDELKEAAKAKGASDDEVNCLETEKLKLEKLKADDVKMNAWKEAGKKLQELKKLTSFQIDELRKKVAKLNAQNEFHAIPAVEAKIEELQKKMGQEEATCLAGLAYEKTQGPRIKWTWTQHGEALAGLGITKEMAEREYHQWHIQRLVGTWSDLKTAEEVLADIQAKIDAEIDTKNARSVDFEVKQILGDKYYYAKKIPEKYAEPDVAQAINQLKHYIGKGAELADAGPSGDSSEDVVEPESELEVPTAPADLNEAEAEAAAKKAEEEDKKYWEDKAAEEAKKEEEREQHDNQVAEEAIQEAIQEEHPEVKAEDLDGFTADDLEDRMDELEDSALADGKTEL